MNKIFLPLLLLIAAPVILSAQYQYQRLNHLQEIRNNSRLYNTEADYHTSVQPLDKWQADSLEKPASETESLKFGYRKWLWRKLFDESLMKVSGENYSFTIDPIVHFRYGYDLATESKPYTSTRGFSIEGKLGEKFSFTSSFLENQARLPQYILDFSDYTNVIPGQGYARPFGGNARDFAMASGEISYSPNAIFSFTLGQGRNFFGEGYRSMILSDVAFNYPFFRIETSFWKVKYVNLWAQLYDVRDAVSTGNVFPKKYLSTHYLSLNITPRWNVSLFESIVIGDTAQQRGIDAAFFNPVILYRPVEFAVGSGSGNALLGFGSSYKLLDGMQVYGQFVLDEFSFARIRANNGHWVNKYSWQLGWKYYNAFNLKGLFSRVEYNAARPYTYSHREPLLNYGHYGQPLAHPWGGNFQEALVNLVYQWQRWEFETRFHYGIIGLDTNGSDWGSDIYISYTERERDLYNETGQGERAELMYILVRAAWLVNPESGLKIEAGAQFRNLSTNRNTTPLPEGRSQYIFIGLRTEFFNRYYDF